MDEILRLVLQTVEENCNLTIRTDELPESDGIYAELAEGKLERLYSDKTAIWIVPIRFFCNHSDQDTCIQNLQRICNYLHRLEAYPHSSWMDSTILIQPYRIGKQENGQYQYSCMIHNKFYF